MGVGRLRHAPLPRWLWPGWTQGRVDGMSRRLGRAEGRVWVDRLHWVVGEEGGREACLGVPGRRLTASWELPPWTTPTQGFPGAVPPTLGLSWEGCALPLRSSP